MYMFSNLLAEDISIWEGDLQQPGKGAGLRGRIHLHLILFDTDLLRCSTTAIAAEGLNLVFQCALVESLQFT